MILERIFIVRKMLCLKCRGKTRGNLTNIYGGTKLTTCPTRPLGYELYPIKTLWQTKTFMVRWPGFEPGLAAWQAAVLDQTRLPPLCCR